MSFLPRIPEGVRYQQVTDTFSGLNHNDKITEGEFFDMKNLSSDGYPLLTARPGRGLVSILDTPLGMIAKGALAYVDGSSLYYNGLDITSYLTDKGLAISPSTEKQMVGMGAYIVIFPDKLYVNTEDFTDCGTLEASSESSGNVEYMLCKEDGTAYESPAISATPPADPADGALWMDISNNTHVLKQYSAASATWTQIATVYVKISSPGIGIPFLQFDGVEISGISGNPQLEALNGSKLIQERGDDYLVVIGLIDQIYSQEEGTVTVARKVPRMDYVVECQNRLWGCYYGLADGKTVNEIYCCALGDFRNWAKYQGISTDSYTASVGSDGPWTGAITYLGSPLFWKEDHVHKVYVSAAGAHQIADTALRGVMRGCAKSLCAVGARLYYLSRDGVAMYDGSMPSIISEKLGAVRYRNGVGGALGDKYYLSASDQDGVYSLLAVDTQRGIWCKEDDTQVLAFATIPGDLYMLTADKQLLTVRGTEGVPEAPFVWMGQSGLIGYNEVGKKSISRINLRVVLPQGSWITLETEYDSDGVWHPCGTVTGKGVGSFLLPVRPRRCDHFRFRISGAGPFKLYSLAKIYQGGSDVPPLKECLPF